MAEIVTNLRNIFPDATEIVHPAQLAKSERFSAVPVPPLVTPE